jgi:alanine racemase
MAKATETILEINLKALEHNYRYLRSRIHPKTKFLGVVKAFAYGSDAVNIARQLEQLGADYLAVAYAQEGVNLRLGGIQLPILVLHPQEANFDEIITHQLEPSLYSLKIVKGFLAAVQKQGKTAYPVHLKFNTGLNRLGLNEKDFPDLLDGIQHRQELRIVSVLSHLAATEDEAERAFTKRQIQRFTTVAGVLEKQLGYTLIKHILNTSGILNYPEAQFDMVRSGIGLYGFGNDAGVDAQLKPVAALKTIIAQIHTLEANESVGYNRAYISNARCVTATLPLGHADGIGRQYGNGKAYVSINGQKAYVIGNVCMDMIMVDITGIGCEEGDEAIIFGAVPTAEAFASFAGTISYELLTGISQRVKRVLIEV